MSNGRRIQALFALALLASCEAAEDVRVQPLPPLDRPSPEARAGLPELAGVWRFAGWDLAPTDSAGLQRELPGLGEIRLQTQRLDSLAGAYAGGGGALPLVGEVRRDSVVSLVASAGGGTAYYLAGEYARDTLWIRLSSLVEPGVWPDAAVAAFVRGDVAATFVRLHGTTPAPPVDSALLAMQAAADSAAAQSPGEVVALAAVGPGVFIASGERDAFGFLLRPRTAERPAPAAPRVIGQPMQPTAPQAAPEPEPPAPRQAPPEPEPEEPPAAEPVPEIPAPRIPRLLGEPVRTDTVAIRPSPRARGAARGW